MSAALRFSKVTPADSPERVSKDLSCACRKQNGPPFGGPFVISRCPITEPALVPEQGPARVRVREPGRVQEPGLAPERGLARVPEQVSQARGLACWRPAVQPGPGHVRRRFCQRHNTQRWPG